MQIKFQTTTYLWHVDYPDECIEWGSWISNSKPMGKFKDDIEHIDTLMAQSSCSNPVLIKCATHGYVTEVSKDVFLVMTKTRLFLLNAFMAWVSEVSGAHKQTNIASNQVACWKRVCLWLETRPLSGLPDPNALFGLSLIKYYLG